MTRTTGIEFKAFVFDRRAWPVDQYCEDETIIADDKDVSDWDAADIQDTAIVKIEGGNLYDENAIFINTLESHFRKWRKTQTHATIVCKIKKDKIESFKDHIIQFPGAKIIK